jgi:hypothetical protein
MNYVALLVWGIDRQEWPNAQESQTARPHCGQRRACSTQPAGPPQSTQDRAIAPHGTRPAARSSGLMFVSHRSRIELILTPLASATQPCLVFLGRLLSPHSGAHQHSSRRSAYHTSDKQRRAPRTRQIHRNPRTAGQWHCTRWHSRRCGRLQGLRKPRSVVLWLLWLA